MTLALATVCEGGLMIAADTRVSYQDGTIGDVQKVTGFAAHDGMLTIAHSSHDANAADSLIRKIRERIENSAVGNFSEVEHRIEDALREWYVPIHDDRPTIQLLVGACVQSSQSERALYLCEPPNTVSRIWDSYRAIGDGWRISDPIYKWFERRESRSAHACLCQISYMMHRAKKLLPGSVGGQTDVAFLIGAATAPYWIKRVNMATAEAYGINLDCQLSSITSAIMGNNPGEIAGLLEGIEQCNLLYSSLRSHTQIEHYTITA